MNKAPSSSNLWQRAGGAVMVVYRLLAPRAWSVIVYAALLCCFAVKFYHGARYGLLREYPAWILTDVAVLLSIDLVLSLICYRWPRKAVWRGATIFAAIVCTWSVMNAGWLIRTGTQILPMELLPLVRDPINIGKLVLRNLIRMPGAAAALLLPSAVALTFLFSVLARPVPPNYHRDTFRTKIGFSLVAIVVAVLGMAAVWSLGSAQITAPGLTFNCHARAILAFLLPQYRNVVRDDFSNARRRLPRAAEVTVALKPYPVKQNVIVVILEGVQYSCTSLPGYPADGGDGGYDPTPFMATLAAQGVSFSNARSVVTHTTKAIFALMTGRRPGAVQDIGETVPVAEPYASLATILRDGLGYRTAFFQSPTGTFESRPGLVYNLGFDKFFARENLHDPNSNLGYLGADEFALLDPIRAWIESDDKPFLLTYVCSATHDPYEVPEWYGEIAPTPAERYEQTITYTDRFIAAFDVQLADLGLTDNTILCVVGDHGEAFGEHRIQGHERCAFDEVLHIVMCMRAPLLIAAGQTIDSPVSSVDLTPTILNLLGVEIDPFDFDGTDILAPLPKDRKVHFAGWMQQGPSGYIEGGRKFVYHPEQDTVTLNRLSIDPLELAGVALPDYVARQLRHEIVQWRRDTIFRIEQERTGEMTLFDTWLAEWNTRRRECGVKYVGTP